MSRNEDKTKKGFSRREVIKSGVALGGATLLAGHPLRINAQFGGGGYNGGGTTNSPPTIPFVDELPIPPVAQPVSPFSPAPNPAAFQRYAEFPPQKFYDISLAETFHSFHRDLPVSPIWGYNGIFPGPTFYARYNQSALVRFRNNLPANSVGFGMP